MKIFTWKRITVAAVLLFAAIIHFTTPSVWRWWSGNLQVYVHRNFPTDGTPRQGSYGFSAGWSKMAVFALGSGSSATFENSGAVREEIRVRLTGVTHDGVWVTITCHNAPTKNSGLISFDRAIYVPATSSIAAPARIEISDEYYITGYFALD